VIAVSPVRHATDARRRAQAYTVACDRLLYDAWHAIAASKRRLRPRIRGGSALDPVTETVRAALRAGALPRIDGRSWAGQAYGNHPCACCGSHIQAGDAEYEPQGAQGRYVHIACFTVWRVESARLEQGDGARPSGAVDER
jgi:hypothetical protein